MRIKTCVLVGLVLWAWSAAPVFTQELEFVPKNGGVGIYIGDLPQDAAYCNVNKSSLDTAVRLPLGRNGFRVNPLIAQTEGYLYVSLNVLKLTFSAPTTPIGCAINVSVEFVRRASLPSGTLIYRTTVWNRRNILAARNINTARMVRDTVEGFTEEWIAQWLIDNPQ